MEDMDLTEGLFQERLPAPLDDGRLASRLAAWKAHTPLRIAAFVAVAWLPLCLLAFHEGTLYAPGTAGTLLLDFGAIGRYLGAGPLLIAGTGVCMAVLGGIAQRLGTLCNDADPGGQHFAQLVAATRRRHARRWPAVALLCIALLLSTVLTHALPWHELPAWHRAGAQLSLAGWWNACVSLPLLLMLLLGWLWRLARWSRFLWRVSQLPLCLVPVHPDQAGGIGFVGYSLRGFSPFAAAFGAMMAGAIANRTVHGGIPLADHRMAIIGAVAGMLLLCGAPLLLFSTRLMRTWWRGVRDYAALASEFGRAFEAKWFSEGAPTRCGDLLDTGDFSAAADLYQVVDRIHALRVVPVDLLSAVALAAATLLPLVPVVLLVIPFDVLLAALASLLR
ncbi:hypothetical protein [Comamonas antarctica]|uniref:hypothetical protein n=1 Tax=Comamonas antarctica TaxID=2743470 RepID=UPI0028E582F8|nr:hypothetical protein [Comamonas antarctica]